MRPWHSEGYPHGLAGGRSDTATRGIEPEFAALEAQVTALKAEIAKLRSERTREVSWHVLGGLVQAAATIAVGAAADVLDEPLFWAFAGAVALFSGAFVVVRTRRRAAAALRTELETTLSALDDAKAERDGLQSDLEATTRSLDDYRKAMEAEVRVDGAPVYACGGRHIIGVDIGRVWLTAGLLTVDDGDTGRLLRLSEEDHPERSIRESPLIKKAPQPSTDPIDFYGEVASIIEEVARTTRGPIDGVGLGVPGQIDPASGTVLEYPQAFARGERFVSELGWRLRDSDKGLSELFRRNRIFIDNDVRCATRRVLSAHIDEEDWANFAVVFVGGGVGGGLVLNRQILYGADRSAGEVGHMTIHLSPEQRQILDDGPQQADSWTVAGLAHEPQNCECKNPGGVHWEPLLNGPGLTRLATQLDSGCARRIAEAFGQPRWERDRPAPEQITVAVHLLEQQGVALKRVERALHAKGSKSPTAARDAIAELMTDTDMVSYAERLRRCYARYFAAGIANLVNLLDLDHVSLGGGVMDALWGLSTFRDEVHRVLEKHALGTALDTSALLHYDPQARPGWAWEGAALMFWDPGYEVVRRRREAASELPPKVEPRIAAPSARR